MATVRHKHENKKKVIFHTKNKKTRVHPLNFVPVAHECGDVSAKRGSGPRLIKSLKFNCKKKTPGRGRKLKADPGRALPKLGLSLGSNSHF